MTSKRYLVKVALQKEGNMYWRNILRCRFVAVVLALVLLASVLAACGGGGGGEQETPTVSPTLTATVAPTETPIASETAAPTATPSPTAAPTATPTPTAITTATPSPTPAGPVKIGVVHDFSGSDALSGSYYAERLIKLATKQMKDQGGILGGREVQYLKYDAKSTLAGCQTAATEAILKDHVSVIIEGGSASVNGEALGTIAKENHTLYVDLFILPLDIINNPYVIRPGYRMDEMDAMLNFGIKVLKAKTIGIFERDFQEDHLYADSWKKIASAAGVKVVYEDYYAIGTPDLTSFLTKIKYANPDLLLTDCLLADYPTMAMEMQGLGGWGNIKVINSMAAALCVKMSSTNGWYIYARWLPGSSDPGSVKFIQDYKAMFGAEPDCVMELMYDPFMWAVKAIELAGTDEPEAVARAARSGNLTWDSPGGPLSIGTDGEVTPQVHLIAQFQGGKMVPVPPWEE